jgi:outer membrane protein
MTAAISEELKVGYVDTVKIFANYSKTVEAEEKYKQEIEEWRKKAKEMEAEIAEMREAIQSQSLMLSEEKISEKRLELDQKIKEYQDYMQEIFGDQGEAAKRNQELTQPLVEEINSVIAEIAEEEGYTIIFDAAQGSLLYARDEIDMTDMVLERLKEKGTSMME